MNSNPNFDFVYQVINNIYIYKRVRDLNIYMYRRGIYNKPPKKYNNRKGYYTSNNHH
jgi:hypothetical protein